MLCYKRILRLTKDALNGFAYKELKFQYSRFNSVILFILSGGNLLRFLSEHMNYELGKLLMFSIWSPAPEFIRAEFTGLAAEG